MKPLTVYALFTIFFMVSSATSAEELKPIKLLKPDMEGGRPLMQVLKDRKSTREYSPEMLTLKDLSNLLWAAWGINRPESGKRTAPSASNRQEIDIYVTISEGVYVYDAREHILKPVLAKDIRAVTGTQPWVKNAPVNLVFVADYGRMNNPSEAVKNFSPVIDTGYISQNVYLYCASEGLSTVARGLVDKPALAKAMNLRPDQMVILAQSVGYPPENSQYMDSNK